MPVNILIYSSLKENIKQVMYSRKNNQLNSAFLIIFITFTISGCQDGNNENGCDMIANPDGPAYLKVINKTDVGLEWYFQTAYAFGADMRPGECVKMGVIASQYTLHLQQCNIGEEGCESNFGTSRLILFSVEQSETYTLSIENAFFD